MTRRLPAEWEPQAGVLLAWPDGETDWASRLDQARDCYAALLAALTSHVDTGLVVRPGIDGTALHSRLACAGVRPERLRLLHADYDDTWIRDYGPVTVLDGDEPRLLDFMFDGWGGKFSAGRDNAVTHALHGAGRFGETSIESADFVLEGGAIDSDGAGSILTTAACWRARHPSMDRAQVERRLARWLGAERVLWLEHGHLEGDDTDAHVDTLARFCAADTIAYQACADPHDSHHGPLEAMCSELKALRTATGRPYRLIALPWPGECRDDDGRRLPATYANFLITNGAVLVPTYGVPADQAALDALSRAFPEHRLRGIYCRPLIWQNGGLHCATMQLPAAVTLDGENADPRKP